MSSGTSWSCSKFFAQMPMMKPNRLKLMQVSARKPSIASGCAHRQVDEEVGGGVDDEADDEGLGRRRADVADDDLEEGDRRRQELVDRADELREVDAEGGVGDRLHQHGQHDQAGHDEGAVGDALDLLDARADGGAEDHEVERGRDHRRDQALEEGAEGPRHLEACRSRGRRSQFMPPPSPGRRRCPRASSAGSAGRGARCPPRRGRAGARRCRCAWPRGRRRR